VPKNRPVTSPRLPRRSLRSKYADFYFLEKVFSARISAVSAVMVISPQSALRYAEGRREETFGCGSAALRISAVSAVTIISPQSALRYAEGRRESLSSKAKSYFQQPSTAAVVVVGLLAKGQT
jgi:hypothetical protein